MGEIIKFNQFNKTSKREAPKVRTMEPLILNVMLLPFHSQGHQVPCRGNQASPKKKTGIPEMTLQLFQYPICFHVLEVDVLRQK